jgi:hypothetical protein
MGKHLEGVWALNVNVGHMVGLVKKHTALTPGTLFVPPVRIFGRDYGIDVCSNLRIPQQVRDISGTLQQRLQIGKRRRWGTHICWVLLLIDKAVRELLPSEEDNTSA